MPSFIKANKQSTSFTDNEMEAIRREIVKDYEKASREILDEIKTFYAKMPSSLSEADMYNYAIKFNRLDSMLKDVSSSYIKYSNDAGKKQILQSEIGIINQYYRKQYLIDWFSPLENIVLDFQIINEAMVEQSVLGTIESWKRIQTDAFAKTWGSPELYQRKQGSLTQLLVDHRTDELQKIRRTITSGLIQGESYSKQADKIKNIIGIVSKDGTVSGAKASALNIARTEGTRNLNAGSLANTEQARSQGASIVRMWDATLDMKTRSSHGYLDGKKENENGQWCIGSDCASYPGGFASAANSSRCRCSVNDLLDGVPPLARAGINPVTGERELFEWKSFGSWMKGNDLKQSPTGKIILK